MENVVFINIEPESSLKINNYQIKPEIPLPILLEDLKGVVKDKELPWPAFARGIIHVFSQQPKHVHAAEYKAFIYAFNPKIEEQLLSEGAQLAGEGKYETAIVIFKSLINLNPELAEVRFNLGLCFQELAEKIAGSEPEQSQEHARSAMAVYEQMVNQNSNYPLVYYNLGFLYRHAGLLAQAKETWEKAVELGIDQDRATELNKLINELDRLDIVEAQYESGVNAINKGRFKDGITLLKPLAKRYPHWWQAAYYLGLAYRNLDEYEQAKEIFEEIVAGNPAIPEPYSQIGLCSFALGDMDEAEQALQKAISLSDGDSGYLGNLGLVYLRQKRYPEAAEIFYQAQALAPEDALIQHYISELPSEYQK